MVVLNTISFHAQIENIPISKEVTIDRFYVGLLANTDLSNENNKHGNLTSFQFGTRVRLLLIPEKLQIRTFGVFKQTETNGVDFFRSYESIFTPIKNISIHIGVMATPTTELRPNPTTWQSQVETNSESNIIGGRKGLKINYILNKNLKIAYGLHMHDNATAHHFKVSLKQLTVSSYIEDGNLFSAIKWDYTNGNVLITRFKSRISASSIVPISEYYQMNLDIEFDRLAQNPTYFALGIRRIFPKSRLIKGFLSLNYYHHSKSLQGSLFIHI